MWFYVSICFKICIYICVLFLYFNDMSILMSWGRQYLVNRVNEKDPKLQLWQMGVRICSIWEEFIKKGIEYDPFLDWYWSVIIISFIYWFIWTNKRVYCQNIGLSYEVNVSDYHLSAINWGDHPDLVHGRGYGRSDLTGNVLVVVCSVQRSSECRQKRDGIVL